MENRISFFSIFFRQIACCRSKNTIFYENYNLICERIDLKFTDRAKEGISFYVHCIASGSEWQNFKICNRVSWSRLWERICVIAYSLWNWFYMCTSDFFLFHTLSYSFHLSSNTRFTHTCHLVWNVEFSSIW